MASPFQQAAQGPPHQGPPGGETPPFLQQGQPGQHPVDAQGQGNPLVALDDRVTQLEDQVTRMADIVSQLVGGGGGATTSQGPPPPTGPGTGPVG